MTVQKTSARALIRFGALAAALMLACAGNAMAQDDNKPAKDLPRAKDSSAAEDAKGGTANAFAPNARLAALIRPGGGIVRQQGVASVTNPEVGLYCIEPEAGINTNNAIVIVNPEFHFSEVNEIKVQWISRRTTCGPNRFGVVTLEDFNLDARYHRSNHVAFSIVVP
jgi:hypothetical protein